MRRIFISITIMLVLILAGFSSIPEVDLSTSSIKLSPFGAKPEENSDIALNYQGYVEVKTTMRNVEYKRIEMLTIKDIKFSVNKNGLPVL